MAEWICLHVLDQDPMREILVELINLRHINLVDCTIFDLPDMEVVRDKGDAKLHDPCHNDDNDDERGDYGVRERIVLVS